MSQLKYINIEISRFRNNLEIVKIETAKVARSCGVDAQHNAFKAENLKKSYKN